MIGRDYLARQAKILLELANVTRNPAQAARIADKAVELKERCERVPARETSLAPDIQRKWP
jgi:hypothetical protein